MAQIPEDSNLYSSNFRRKKIFKLNNQANIIMAEHRPSTQITLGIGWISLDIGVGIHQPFQGFAPGLWTAFSNAETIKHSRTTGQAPFFWYGSPTAGFCRYHKVSLRGRLQTPYSNGKSRSIFRYIQYRSQDHAKQSMVKLAIMHFRRPVYCVHEPSHNASFAPLV